VLLSAVLLVSGYCSLTYQVVWIRDFRLIFGGTTAAMAVVLSVFMGGLGVGGAVLGKRAETSPSPLRFYAWIEIGIALSTALSPFLMIATRWLYFRTGGEAGLGYGVATLLRCTMTVAVIGLPCFLMGGTLPALARHLQHHADTNRRVTGWLYGINIWGGLLGVALTTCLTLEFIGSRNSLWLAAGLNLLIGFVAYRLGRSQPASRSSGRSPAADTLSGSGGGVPTSLTYGAAFVTGLGFFAMELAWYRLSVPLTGGTVYALGMVLMVVLLGLGLGGNCYSLLGRRIGRRPGAFAAITALQTGFLLVPYLLGDWFAWAVAMQVKSVAGGGFSQMAGLWLATVAALALIPSILAGMQFPMLLSLLGRGGEEIGSQLGKAYAWNTSGAIAGSLLGGFVLLPILGAEGLWLASAALGGVLAICFLTCSVGHEIVGWLRPLRVSILAFLLVLAASVAATRGPGATWRDSAIGFGRVESIPESAADCPAFFADREREILRRWEGRESAVAVAGMKSLAVMTNGKSDSSLHGDAPTTIGLALIPAALHRTGVRSGAVIGLGTGVTAGWLAAFPGVEQVDVMEIEPSMVKAQKWFEGGNLNPLGNPKVNLIIGDARETLATRGRDYDVIISEPSNLTRAGVCNFYTVEFYQRCALRMKDGAIFTQWLQGYDLDPISLAQVCRTMAAVFTRVELWSTKNGDLVLLGSFDHAPYDLGLVEQRLGEPTFRQAMIHGFTSDSVEGFFARFVTDSTTLKSVTPAEIPLNRDDRNTLEFRVARQAGRKSGKTLESVLGKLYQISDISTVVDGSLDRETLMREGILRQAEAFGNRKSPPERDFPIERALWHCYRGRFAEFRLTWVESPQTLGGSLYTAISATASYPNGAAKEIGGMREAFPAEAHILIGVNMLDRVSFEAAFANLGNGLSMQRESGLKNALAMDFACAMLLKKIPGLSRPQQERLFGLLEQPFQSNYQASLRLEILEQIAMSLGGEFAARADRAREDARKPAAFAASPMKLEGASTGTE
jgi:spermidine synthase